MSFSRKGKLLVNIMRLFAKKERKERGFVELLKSFKSDELGVIQKSFSKYIAKDRPDRVFNNVPIHLLMDSERLAVLSKKLLDAINSLTVIKEKEKPSHSTSVKGLDVFHIARDKDKKKLEATYNEILEQACDLLDVKTGALDPEMLERLGYKKNDLYFADPKNIWLILISYFEAVQGSIITNLAENKAFYASPRNIAAGIYFSQEYKIKLEQILHALLLQRLERYILKKCDFYKASEAEKNILEELRTGKNNFSDRLEVAYKLSSLGSHASLANFLNEQRTVWQQYSKRVNLIAIFISESTSPIPRESQSGIEPPLSPVSTTSEESETSSCSSRGSWSAVGHTDLLVAHKLQDASESKEVEEESLSDSPYFLVPELTENVVDDEVEESALSPHVALSSFSPKKVSVLVSWDKEDVVSSSLTLS